MFPWVVGTAAAAVALDDDRTLYLPDRVVGSSLLVLLVLLVLLLLLLLGARGTDGENGKEQEEDSFLWH